LDNLRAEIRRWPETAAQEAGTQLSYELQGLRDEMKYRTAFFPLHMRSGRLTRSWVAEVKGQTLSTLTGRVRSLSQYTYLHEEGGTIAPPPGKSWIFITTPFNRRAVAGRETSLPRLTVEQVIAQGGRFISLSRREYRRALGIPKPSDDPVTDPKVDPQLLAQLKYKTRAMVIDAAGVPMFTQVKHATYQPVLEFAVRGQQLADHLPQRMADRLVLRWQGAKP
jgi:hypothetical protein